jgi:hypothetical protein
MRVTKRQLRRIIREEQQRRIIREELLREQEEEAPAEKIDTTAGKKAAKAMDSSAMKPFQIALNQAKNKDAVKEILSQVFAALGDDGQKYLKQALKELAQEL